MDRRIVRNSARCLKCGVEVVSRHCHDFVSCDCKAMFVDGGKDYLRRGGEPSLIEETSRHGWVKRDWARRIR
jgi:hypothetical protein